MQIDRNRNMLPIVLDFLIIGFLVGRELLLGRRFRRFSTIIDCLLNQVGCQNGISSNSEGTDHTTDSFELSGKPNMSKHFSTQKNVEP